MRDNRYYVNSQLSLDGGDQRVERGIAIAVLWAAAGMEFPTVVHETNDSVAPNEKADRSQSPKLSSDAVGAHGLPSLVLTDCELEAEITGGARDQPEVSVARFRSLWRVN